MDNENQKSDAIGALRMLSEICREAVERNGGDFGAALASVRARLERLPPEDRAGLDDMLQSILRFEPPPSRASQ